MSSPRSGLRRVVLTLLLLPPLAGCDLPKALDPGAPAPAAHDCEIAGVELAVALGVEHDRHARREERLADDELAPPRDLDDDGVGQTCRNRRRVRPCKEGIDPWI